MKLTLGAPPAREPAPPTTDRRRGPRRFTRDRRRTKHELAQLRALTPDGTERQSSLDSMKRDLVFRRGLALADVTGAALALFACQSIFQELSDRDWIFLGVPVVVIASKAIGLYDRDELVIAKTTLNEAPALFQLATLYTLLITMFAGADGGPGLPPAPIVALWGLLWAGLALSRAVARSVARRLTTPERCVLLGNRSTAERLRTKFLLHDALHADLVAYLPFDQFDLNRQRSKAFAAYIAERDIHRVIIGGSDSHEEIADAVRYFKGYGLKVSVLPSLLEVVGSAVEFDDVHGTTLLGVRRFGLSRSSTALKRAFDLVGSLVLVVFLSPLLLWIALAITIGSRGPVLFRQTRVGRDGKRFTMFKFRTMYEDADERRAELEALNETDGVFKVADDPRVTRVGRLLRKSSLDELPQLLNVVRGEMSLVGPRPLVLEEDARVEGWHRRRLHLMPGMTGAWQIVGGTRVPLREMVMMDYQYIVNWSPWADVKILLQTVPHVLLRRGL
jgi:exopolysaccharide biosynthesis polyprenyl glycosylphosphotransferase